MIYLAPLHNPHPQAVTHVTKHLRQIFDTPILDHNLQIDVQRAFDPTRRQYNSTILLAELLGKLPTLEDKLVAVTEVDLFIPILTFVFGEAQLNGNVAIVSTHRLRNSFYGLPENQEVMLRRLEKEVLHELGHLYNLTHCPDYLCVMHASTVVEEVDLKNASFCRRCSALIRSAGR